MSGRITDRSDPDATVQADRTEAQDTEAGPDEAYLRLLADFDNYKKRTEARIREAEARGRDALVRDLAPVVAGLEKALADPSGDAEALRRGVRMVLDQLEKVLQGHGYERIETVGKELDPSRHEAVVAVPDGQRRPGTILAELSPGYERSGRLVEPARVAVVDRRERHDAPATAPEGTNGR